MRSAFRHRLNVVDFFDRRESAVLFTLLTQGMRCDESLPGLSPAPAVKFPSLRITLVLVIVAVDFLFVLLTVPVID